MKKKILILGGGISKERQISLQTAKSVYKELKRNKYNTIIIHYEDYKSFIIQILVSLLLQNQNGTLIINIPSNTSNTFLSLINFLMKFYKITIIKPFATRIYTSERYLICENYKNNITNDFIKYINKCLHTIIETKTIFDRQIDFADV